MNRASTSDSHDPAKQGVEGTSTPNCANRQGQWLKVADNVYVVSSTVKQGVQGLELSSLRHCGPDADDACEGYK